MIRYIIAGALIIPALVVFTPREAKALTYEEAVETAYRELVTEGKNMVSFECEDDRVRTLRFFEDFEAIDDEDNLYDGVALDVRGTESISREGGKYYTLTIKRGYDIKEADALTDQMAEEIRERLPENATDRVIYKEIAKYMGETYSYDYAALLDENKITNFVEAYYGDRKIVCSGFASATYLIANKLGLDCRLYLGNRHVYNGIKFDGDDKYTVVDFTTFLYPLGFPPAVAELVPDFNGLGERKEKIDRINSTDPKKYASIIDLFKTIFA